MGVDKYFGWFKGVSKSVQVPSHGIEAVLVLTWMVLKMASPVGSRERV